MSLFASDADFKMDVLREVGNIGAGNAATALSKLLDKPIDMTVPTVSLLKFDEIAEKVGGSETVVVAIYLRIDGDVPGNMFFIITQEAAARLLKGLLSIDKQDGQTEYSEMELSALNEIGNILAGSYLSSLGDFTGLHMSPSVPSISIDMAGAILSYGLLQFGTMGDDALLIDTKFFEGGDETQGQFILIPDPDSFDKLFRALGVPVE